MAGKRTSALTQLYPERKFASFARHEGRFLFYSLVADLLKEDSVVVDFGAGRGEQIEHSNGYVRALIDFKGRCKRYIGIDVDPIVLSNPYVEEAHVIKPDGVIPLGDATVDIIVAYAVLEHVQNPAETAREIDRVLKPGGWFCAWTPNRLGYVGLAARLVPNSIHAAIVGRAEPLGGRQERDVFPVAYRLNTSGAVRRYFDAAKYEHYSFYENGTPSYHFNRVWIARFWLLTMRLLPMKFAKSLFVFVRKRASTPG